MKQNTDSKYRMRVTRVFAGMYILVLITAILGIIAVARHGSSEAQYGDFGDGWTAESGEAVNLKHVEEFGTVSKDIPQLSADQILCFHAKSVNLQVFIGDEPVYQTDVYAKPLFGKTPGSYFVRIPILKEDSGKLLTIKADSPYGDGSGRIYDMSLGSGIDIWSRNVQGKLAGFLVNIIITFIGGFLVVMYFPLKRLNLALYEMLYLGLFSLNIGIYMTTDCGLLSIVTGNEAFWHMVAELWMMTIVIPLTCYLDCKYPDKNNRVIVYLTSAYCMAEFALCYIAHWLEWKDYHELIILTHISYGIIIIYFTYCVVRSMVRKTQGNKGYLAGPIFIFIGVVMDILGRGAGVFADNTMFTRIGMLVFLMFEGLQIIEKVMMQYQQGLKAQILGRLAYYDGLTDLLNRTSFIEAQEKMEREHTCGLIAIFDANYLKKINDTMGHLKGDELIVTIAEAIKDFFGDIGNCYRIGGDEFVLLTGKDFSMKRFTEQLERLPDYLAEKSVEKGIPISVAVGYTVWDDTKHNCFHDFMNEADGYMYENKKQMKAQREE